MKNLEVGGQKDVKMSSSKNGSEVNSASESEPYNLNVNRILETQSKDDAVYNPRATQQKTEDMWVLAHFCPFLAMWLWITLPTLILHNSSYMRECSSQSQTKELTNS